MKKFKCTVMKQTDMIIEMDDSVWTPEAIKKWSEYFYDADSLSDVAGHLARMKSEQENGVFLEGLGIPIINGQKPFPYLADDDMNQSINICMEETHTDVEIEEI